jgi:hypothetical protein
MIATRVGLMRTVVCASPKLLAGQGVPKSPEDLAGLVTLDYPTFDAAAAGCGMSRIWAGIHWPADDERGQELGAKVGDNAWQRYQQFVLGFASPPTAAFATLRPPYRMHENEAADHPASFDSVSGLVVDLSPGASGAWQSTVLDPPPVGNYELRLKVAVSGNGPAKLDIAVKPTGAQAAPIAERALVVPATGSSRTVTVPWTADGARPFKVSALLRTQPDRAFRSVAAAARNHRLAMLSPAFLTSA